jgi:hypothetical protein
MKHGMYYKGKIKIYKDGEIKYSGVHFPELQLFGPLELNYDEN